MASPPAIRISFPLSGLEMVASTLTVRMAEYTHDLAIVTFDGLISSPTVTGAPVYIAWGYPNAPTAFFGYFDHLVVNERTTALVCVGSSYPMKGAAQQIWTDSTADQVAYQLADAYQLDADITPHDRVFPQLSQAGESDWQFLNRVAKSVGYTCYTHQTQLRFHPRTRDFLALQDRCPVFRRGDIYSFHPVTGNAVPDENGNTFAASQLTALDNAGEVFTTSYAGVAPLAGSVGYTPPFASVTQAVVDSASDALATLTADREMHRWYLTADAVVRGSVLLRQAMPVYLGGLTADNTGYWYVLAAEHRVVPSRSDELGRYTVALKLGRDSQGQSVTAPSLDPSVLFLGVDPATGVGDVSSPRLVNGRWQASRSVAYTPVEATQPDFVRDRLDGRG